MTIRTELLDELLKESKKPEDLMREGGILKELTKALVERCLNGEIDYQMQEEKVNPTQEGPKIVSVENLYSAQCRRGRTSFSRFC